MTRSAQFILPVLAILLLGACAAFSPETGRYVSPEQMAQFEDGKTKQADVIAVLGHPNNKSQLNNREVWHYDYTKAPYLGKIIDESSVFEFNAKGILLNHYKTNQSQR